MFWWSPKQSNVFNCEIILSELTVCLETFTSFEDDWTVKKWPEMLHEKLYLSLYLNKIIWNVDAKYNSLM